MENETNKTQFRPLVVIFCLLLVLTLVVSAIPQAPAAAQNNCSVRHTVASGDTLSYVATLYSVAWEDIAQANSLQPPYVLTVGTVLCIPGGTNTNTGGTGNTNGNDNTNANDNDNDNSNTSGGTPSLLVSPGFHNVYVEVNNFLPRTVYYVRAHPDANRTPGAEAFNRGERIGQFKTNRSGDFDGWFRLPASFPYTLDIGVCVKNAETDAVSCSGLENTAPFVSALLMIRCEKEGR